MNTDKHRIYSMIKTKKISLLVVFLLTVLINCIDQAEAKNHTYDVVIYGGTSGGIAAAVQVKRMGRSVVVLEPSSRIGGLTTGGLGQTDIGNKKVIGGISREFYRRVRQYYQDPSHWKWQKQQEYQSHGQSLTRKDEDTMWTFEPSAALELMKGFCEEYDIPRCVFCTPRPNAHS